MGNLVVHEYVGLGLATKESQDPHPCEVRFCPLPPASTHPCLVS